MMTLNVETFVLGPLENNTYLLTDEESRQAAVVDPSIPSRVLLDALRKNSLELKYLLVTHAHFDHIGGVSWLKSHFDSKPQSILHRKDLDLWLSGGGASDMGFEFNPGSQPDLLIEQEQQLLLGKHEFIILHTPGHTPGHVVYYFPSLQIIFCGDLIFHHGVGRTDLRYSNEKDLYHSIRQKILTLPDNVKLYPGHGLATSVGEEKCNNPFLS